MTKRTRQGKLAALTLLTACAGPYVITGCVPEGLVPTVLSNTATQLANYFLDTLVVDPIEAVVDQAVDQLK